MRRRDFITLLGGAAATWPRCAEAQLADKTWRIGHVFPAAPTIIGHLVGSFEQHLLEQLPVRNFTVVRRFPDPQSVGEAVRSLVPDIDVLVVWTTAGGIAAKQYATSIPCVFLGVGAPVEIGLVQSLNRPGGNMTGITFEAATETYAKRLQLLTEIVPNLNRVAVLRTIGDPNVTFAMESVTRAAPLLKVDLTFIDIKNADELPNAFAAMKASNAQALLIISSAVVYGANKQVAELAFTNALPSCSPFREQALAGGLVSLGPDAKVMAQQGAGLVNKIINGTKPSEIPVEQPSRYEIFINLKTASALGLTVPPTLLARADSVIE